ncbi:hypothetical protein H7K45_27860 [Mycobacterium yunnanensis]|uniref:Uncharacterized protein n=1 Tax=Mycobacterium yunnanensis TaxID=368477 RepID=A0A9X2ZBF3_9MYCO|nr:hypothetical protein [Mycobacterium yunnanensis]MCV7424367.1 hypothetical protein [Mycobacterium yunnanensis]
MTDIPDTELTQKLRAIWEGLNSLTDDAPTWEQWYAEHAVGGTPNGRALAAILFDRACTYWPDYFRPTDSPAVAVWGELIDNNLPFATPEVIEQAVDHVAETSDQPPGGPAPFIRAVRHIMEGPPT